MLNMGQLSYIVEEVLPLSIVRRMKIQSSKLKICVHDMCRNDGKCGVRLPKHMRSVRDCLVNRFVKPLKSKVNQTEQGWKASSCE